MAGYRGKYKGRKRNEPRTHGPRESERTVMLNQGRLSMFRYGLREIMGNYKVDEASASSLIASVIAKGSRVSIDSARMYVLEQEKLGLCPKEATDEICDLLDKFSRYR